MNVGKRAFLYLTRKKGKNLLLGIVFLLISFSLLAGSSVYLGIQQVLSIWGSGRFLRICVPILVLLSISDLMNSLI